MKRQARRPWWLAFGVAVLAFACPDPGAAQLSPGLLSAPHAGLEGSSHCLECHSSERGVDPERCLSCHRALADRIAAGAGLHARDAYRDCKTCHIDHHGREFDLVWWGDAGIEAFDHLLTGHRLEGRHANLGCRDCHRPELNRSAGPLLSQGKDMQRTFLGLGAQCVSCHRDEHRGQFEADRCLSCHDQEAWRPAKSFRHDETRFRLTGLHRQVACEGCHAVVQEPIDADSIDPLPAGIEPPEEEIAFVRFTGLAFGRCKACHQDPHSDRFGAGCEECHSTAGWLRVDTTRFDHDRTRYPLRGRHRAASCESCHLPGVPKRGLGSERCSDCHADEHAGQMARRLDGGRCESCHSVDGFKPAGFDLDRHDEVFVLEGAHRSVACDGCHGRVTAESLVREGVVSMDAARGRRDLMRLRFASTECHDCHSDPHSGTAGAVSERLGCTTCHETTDWKRAAFDHTATDFELEGPHAKLGCVECHRQDPIEPPERLGFSGLGVECFSCHEDRHGAQFAKQNGVTDCRQCHRPDSWLPADGFDHLRDAEFSLEGAHARVPCDGCHRPESVGGVEVIRYKPLAQRCSDCHAG